MQGPDEQETKECIEHGPFPASEMLCPGCEAVDAQIDEAIERAHERVKKGGNYYGET